MNGNDGDHLDPSPRSRLRSAMNAIVFPLGLTLALLALCAGYGRYRFGSMATAIAYLKGERLMVDGRSRSLAGVSGEQVEVRYALSNWTGQPVKLIGAQSSCSCTAVEGVPMALAASETRPIKATIKIDESSSDIAGSIRLFTDSPGIPEIKLAYMVRVAPAPRPPDAHHAD